MVAFGEALLRYSVPLGERLWFARELRVHAAGAELNLAADLAQVGVDVRYVSAIPDNPVGRLATTLIQETGLSTAYLRREAGRMGVFYFEPGAPPRPGRVEYDRADSAFALFPWDQHPWNEVVAGASWLFTTGITAALGAGPLAGVRAALAAAGRAGVRRAFDINYRAKLWSPEEAAVTLRPLLADVDLLFTSQGDAARILGAPLAPGEEMVQWVSRQFGIPMVAMVYNPSPASAPERPSWRCVAWRAGELAVFDQPAGVLTVDRVGAGDAFAAGFLYGLLGGHPLETALRYGSALMALKNTVLGDFARLTREELEEVVATGWRSDLVR